MKSIFIHIWGYKDKTLPEAVKTLIENQSGQHSINIAIYDQTNIDRRDRFNVYDYNHVMWDSIESPFTYLNKSLKNQDSDYFLYIEGSKFFEKNWDLELVMSCNNSVISGNNDIVFDQNYKFYPAYRKIKTDKAKVTSWIDQEFIFMPTNLFKQFPNISLLKYLGMSDIYSLYCAYKKITVQCIPSAWIKDQDNSMLKSDYIPFSINHKYNTVLDIYKKNKNIYFSDLDCVDILSRLTGFDFNKLNYLPYPQDDVEYSLKMTIDSSGEQRFLQKIRQIG